MPEKALHPENPSSHTDHEVIANKVKQRLKAKKEGGSSNGVLTEQVKPKDSEEVITETAEQPHELSQLVNVGDPVLPDSIDTELESIGAWFVESILSEDEDFDIEVIYKTPDGEIHGRDPVTWEEITPRYDTARGYIDTLQKIREAHQKADEDYQKNLEKLYRQVYHFAQMFYAQWTEESAENS